ncbi:SMP-30/gluconolactonase/LRE family protein [Streptomyces sp. NPDC005522]|uniref:NHL domain-containing protein n=1 Tax=unclassified Streptomyces TaxID=2593676 RepID=UPI0034554140
MTTPIHVILNGMWLHIVNQLSEADMKMLLSVDEALHTRLRANPRAWREHLNACTDGQLRQIARAVPLLRQLVQQVLNLRDMTTIAGVEAGLFCPTGVAIRPDGTVYVTDSLAGRVQRFDFYGISTPVAGTGFHGFGGDEGPAQKATLAYPQGVAVNADGVVYLTDSGNHRIRRIDPDGIITTIAGTGQAGDDGDHGPAPQAVLRSPSGVAVSKNGSVYFADTSNHRIRRIDPDGIITTIAGTGQAGDDGDHGPAPQAALHLPKAVALGADDTVYVADTFNHRIRCVTRDGVITTLAGMGHSMDDEYADACTTGTRQTGEGIFARRTTLTYPSGIAIGKDGLFYVITSSSLRRFGMPH